MAGRYRGPRQGDRVKVKGVTVPYTFWPDSFIGTGRRITSNPWACMATHIRGTLSSSRGIKAMAFLEQSEEFYRTASAQRLKSRPLLYYYSFMNLAKAFLVVRRNAALEMCVHGLKEVQGNVRQRMTITSQCVKANDLGGNRLQVYREFVSECGFNVPSRPTSVRLVDLLEQVVGVHDTYSQTFKKSRKFFPIDSAEFCCHKPRKEVWISLKLRSEYLERVPTAASALRLALTAFEEVESDDGTVRKYESVAVRKYGRSPIEVLPALVKETKHNVWSVLRPGGYRFYLSTIPSSLWLAQVASYYQAMFYFGSVTRYRPDAFEKLIQGKHGWLVEEFVNTQAMQFVYLLGSGLLGSEMILPEMAFE